MTESDGKKAIRMWRALKHLAEGKMELERVASSAADSDTDIDKAIEAVTEAERRAEDDFIAAIAEMRGRGVCLFDIFSISI